MKRALCAFALLLSAGSFTSSASAGDSWIFQRSYYTHTPVTPVQTSRRLTGGPFYTRPQGAYVRSGYRLNRDYIRVGGAVYDNINSWESWVQVGGQF
jgi:hypothetical protein